MKRPPVAFVGVCLLLAPPAFGQSLSERLDHVARKQTQARTAHQTRGHMLKVLTRTPLTVQFHETPAREALEHLRKTLGVHIVGRYSDDRIGYGIDPETPITLDVFEQPALVVLELLLDQCQEFEPCTWQLRGGYVEVGTKQRLTVPSAQEIRHYAVRDLLFDPLNFDNAPKLDIAAALNQAGGFGGGGGGAGGGFGGGGGGSGGGGGGSGGGSIIDPPGEPPDRLVEQELAQEIIDLITRSIEMGNWEADGGSWANIQYFAGTLIVRAPDFIHRQIGGYR
ncbi:MAG: hypothetical protein ACYSU7_15570 [Planctomycetota bacterium]|jgi:uncharacterized membrane protein YgcG